MFKLDLEKAEEPESKLPTSARSSKKQESSRKTSTSALLTIAKPLTLWITTNSGKVLEMGILDHSTCCLRNLYAGQEETVRTGHETMNLFQTGKGVHQGYILSPCLFNFYAEYIMGNAGIPVSSPHDVPPFFLLSSLGASCHLIMFTFEIPKPLGV